MRSIRPIEAKLAATRLVVTRVLLLGLTLGVIYTHNPAVEIIFALGVLAHGLAWAAVKGYKKP